MRRESLWGTVEVAVEHEGWRFWVEVTNVGSPARLTGHPDQRRPEEPPEWVVTGLQVENPHTGTWDTVECEASEIRTDDDVDEAIAAAIREELWQ